MIKYLESPSPTSPWFFAGKNGHDYLSPEDIGDAIRAGASREEVWKATLEAVELHCAEDASCCAFVALEMDRTKEDG